VKFRFLLIPIASLTICSPAHAAVYLTVEQAQALMFPNAWFTPDFRTLTDAQVAAIEKDSGVNVRNRTLQVWRVSTGGWFIADDVVGKHEFIPFVLGLDQRGVVTGIEILEYRESYGYEIRDRNRRAQFTGKTRGAKLTLNEDIQNISGATLSSRHITDRVKRLLSTYAIVFAGAPR
jgi:Na+-translocating ferredoxin:NAD+ oxidoreductase RnfG subunit